MVREDEDKSVELLEYEYLEVRSSWNRVRVTWKSGNCETEILRDLRKSHGSQVGKVSQSQDSNIARHTGCGRLIYRNGNIAVVGNIGSPGMQNSKAVGTLVVDTGLRTGRTRRE